MKVMKKKAAMKKAPAVAEPKDTEAMKVMKKKGAMKKAPEVAEPKAMKAMKVMKKKAAMKKAPAVAEPKAMKAMKVMKKKAAMKAMKVMKAKAVKSHMTKGAIADSLAAAVELKRVQCTKILDHLSEIGATEVKKKGKFVLPGLVMIKTRIKPATKAGK